jgi:hypothetical protein
MSGVKVGTWIEIEYCSIDYSVYGDEVEFQIGEGPDGVCVIATENGLANLVTKGTEALQAIRAQHDAPWNDTGSTPPVGIARAGDRGDRRERRNR